jgi:UDP-N-acetylmuramate: L-alanyl-gamma-D-glutamyl-meso-diaminopimelate ligase
MGTSRMPENQNRIPEHVSKVHLIAVCGTGMGALACMLKNLGLEISGSDQNIYPPMSDFLREQGIQIMEGFKAEHICGEPDLVIVGNAVSRDNPEVQRLMRAGIPLFHASGLESFRCTR